MSDKYGNILGLKLPTDPRWVNVVQANIVEVLIDHAFCEQKAASNCISIIQHYGHLPDLVKELSPIVAEEWGHFRVVLKELDKRGQILGRKRKDVYVNELRNLITKNGNEKEILLDKLLICALIEARSCERFRLLANELPDARMRKFYYKFMVSEAGHYTTFITLAGLYLPKEKVTERWQFWLKADQAIMKAIKPQAGRFH